MLEFILWLIFVLIIKNSSNPLVPYIIVGVAVIFSGMIIRAGLTDIRNKLDEFEFEENNNGSGNS